MANSINPEQTPQSGSKLLLHYLGLNRVITKICLIQIHWKIYHQNIKKKKKKKKKKKIWYFSYICSKHRLRVLVRTASTSTHNLCFWAEIWKIMFTPVNPGMCSWCCSCLPVKYVGNRSKVDSWTKGVFDKYPTQNVRLYDLVGHVYIFLKRFCWWSKLNYFQLKKYQRF